MAKNAPVAPVNRKDGGEVGADKVSGNPNVFKEAAMKKGGKVKRAAGGKIVGRMDGGGVKARLDRPGRKQGGAVGANTSPLSTAHKSTSASKSAD